MVVLSAGRERMGRLGGEAVTQMRQTTTFHLDHHDMMMIHILEMGQAL